ncbi:MAG: NFACT family protein [Christensenellaceae bacterium]
MPQDAFTLYHTAEELKKILIQSKVEKINQPDSDTVVFSMHSQRENFKLLISAHAESARICVTEKNFSNPISAPNFLMLLRKHFSKAVITDVALVNNERIIKLTAECKNELFELCEKEIYVEIMGKFSNVIAVQNGIIIGAIKQSTIDQNNLRPIFPGVKYILPISQLKAEPDDDKALTRVLSNYCEGDFTQYVFENIKGISKQTAFEITQRYALKNNDLNFEKNLNIPDFISFFKDFYVKCKIQPNCTDKDFFITDYITVTAEKTRFESILKTVDGFYIAKEDKRIFTSAKAKIKSVVSAYQKKTEKKLQLLLERLNECLDTEKLKLYGELLISNLYQLKNINSDYVALNDYTKDDYPIIKIPVDKKLTAKENAEKYFKKATKLKNTQKATTTQVDNVNREIEYINTLNFEIDEAKTLSDLQDIEEELKLYGLIKTQKSNKKPPAISKPREYLYNGFTIFVGKNNMQNDKLTLNASRNDVFVHAKDYHSAHVIIKTDGKTVPDDVILFSAEICAYYSKARNSDKVPVDYTLRKFVKKPQNINTGMVFYTNQKTILVTPHEHAQHLI